MSEPIVIIQFRKALKDNTVTNPEAFNKWRNNPEKCSGDAKLEADRLWAEYQSKLNRASSGVNTRMTQVAPPVGRFGKRGREEPKRSENITAASPEVLGEKFHNPYTFLPFPSKAPRRRKPTPLSIDEIEKDRFTGVIDLKVKLLSPLLTNSPKASAGKKGEHCTYDVLAIGDDVVVPATGVRGALRSLMTILTGGTLGYVDEEAWLCQGRDAKLGPAAKATQGKVPNNSFLAEVVKPGGVGRAGTVRLGKTKLEKAEKLEDAAIKGRLGALPRPKANDKVRYLWASDDEAISLSDRQDAKHPWKVKLSGRPIMTKGKREGLFLPGDEVITLPASLWSAYSGRNRHGDHPTLKEGDLIWLEPMSLGLSAISSAADVKSLQWARWGREGERLLNVIDRHHRHILPDAFNPDGMVDEVTDLFGQVPRPDITDEIPSFSSWKEDKLPGPAASFAARVRNGNLVFEGAKAKVKKVALAPLAQPHPGCAPFYRDAGADMAQAADVVSNHNLPLRGFKVYRTTSERGNSAPWHFASQGVYGDKGELGANRQKLNKTCDLLMEEDAPVGCLRITVRALSRRELALLLASCSVDWRLGGGKSLGLDHCRVVSIAMREFSDEGLLGETVVMDRKDDKPVELSELYRKELENDAQLASRLQLWQASQVPVQKMRYPRSVLENRNKLSRGGHVWFQRHSQPRKSERDGAVEGLQVMHAAGEVQSATGLDAVRAQPLPQFDPKNPESDVLYGYDLFIGDGPEWVEQMRDRQSHVKKIELFSPEKHSQASHQSGGNQSQNRDSRQDARRQR